FSRSFWSWSFSFSAAFCAFSRSFWSWSFSFSAAFLAFSRSFWSWSCSASADFFPSRLLALGALGRTEALVGRTEGLGRLLGAGASSPSGRLLLLLAALPLLFAALLCADLALAVRAAAGFVAALCFTLCCFTPSCFLVLPAFDTAFALEAALRLDAAACVWPASRPLLGFSLALVSPLTFPAVWPAALRFEAALVDVPWLPLTARDEAEPPVPLDFEPLALLVLLDVLFRPAAMWCP